MYPSRNVPTADHPTKAPAELLRALFASLAAVIVVGIVIAALAAITAPRDTNATAPADVSANRLTDGWSSYLGAAARPADRPLVDGWNTYLLAPEPDPAAIVDGWSSYLLVDDREAPLVDGWMTRYGQDD
jgi:hypothetical protein